MRSFFVALGLLAAVACSSGKRQLNCPSGQVPFGGHCRLVCLTDDVCATGEACLDTVCQPCNACRQQPQITSVNGTGAPDGASGHSANHLGHSVVITGANLEGASVSLSGGTYASLALPLCDTPSAQRLAIALPSDVVANVPYTLVVSNQAGECTAGVTLLQGDKGDPGDPKDAASVLGLLVTVDGSGSGVDADMLDGQHASAFAAANYRGLTQDHPAAGCQDALASGLVRSGVVWVDIPDDDPDVGAFEVYCDQVTAGGGWALLHNSVAGMATMDFWNIPYAERLGRRGRPSLDSNFYDGSFYQRGLRFMDVVEDLHGHAAVLMIAEIQVPQNFDPETMRFFNPTLISGNAGHMAGQFASGWSAPDYDGDLSANSNCATVYCNVTQHYSACWDANLGCDAESPFADGGFGPHVHSGVLTGIGLDNDGTAYSRVRRLSRFVLW
jgi:hypothetical protein